MELRYEEGPSVPRLEEVAVLPTAGDNAAVATSTLKAGTRVLHKGRIVTLATTVMEGHRFIVDRIARGEALLSWGLPFGYALRDVEPGEYACNDDILETLRARHVNFELPEKGLFNNLIEPFEFKESEFVPGQPTKSYGPEHTLEFQGYARGPDRGVGTRNYVVVVGVTSHVSSFARLVAARAMETGLCDGKENVTGVVAVAHTEGGDESQSNNRALLLRTLAGFLVHANVGAVLLVESRSLASVHADHVVNEASRLQYPVADSALATYDFDISKSRTVDAAVEDCVGLLKPLVKTANGTPRTPQPLSALRIALQCGGSDAFSGISGNPLSAWVARELIAHGGAAVLAETDELIGAESYILRNCRDEQTARQFLTLVENFKGRCSNHGKTAEGNPSGGNKYRGLYNICLKSLGAAVKRNPDVRLDYVLDYGERACVNDRGYYFMDSPGNDLESIAGQVATGCNMVFFITGNGSITNFPFVPTVKIVTTTARYHLLVNEMDVNAGEYLDGVPMDVLGSKMLALTRDVASGIRTKGELAGHSQVSIWRNWARKDDGQYASAAEVLEQDELIGSGKALSVTGSASVPKLDVEPRFSGYRIRTGGSGPSARVTSEALALVMPTSLCSGEVARNIAKDLESKLTSSSHNIRFVSLPHTEGCGVAGAENLYIRTMVGHLLHPMVLLASLLEHGCEKTHNDYMRDILIRHGGDPKLYGWGSIQQDGGIAKVHSKTEAWFRDSVGRVGAAERAPGSISSVVFALHAVDEVPADVGAVIGAFVAWVVEHGGSVVVPQNSALMASLQDLGGVQSGFTLAYGQRVGDPGLHIMNTPTRHWVENLTGLAATGAELIVTYVRPGTIRQGHPMVPVLQLTSDEHTATAFGADPRGCVDHAVAVPCADVKHAASGLAMAALGVLSRATVPVCVSSGNVDFQISRGLDGLSM